MVPVKTVAEYILSLSSPEVGDIISNLKLQKLLYYCQGFHLALYNKPLFSEEIQHWDHGPVVPKAYHIYKSHDSNAIPVPRNADFSKLSKEQKTVINEVFNSYGQYSAWKLTQFTHTEPTWMNTKSCEVITHKQLSDYFRTQIEQDINEQDKTKKPA